MGLARGGWAALCCSAVVWLFVQPVFGQTAERDVVAAEALFESGKRLLAEGKLAEACSAFEESLKLDDGIGTRFHLARCHELSGRTASAWALYLEVAAAARASGQTEREELARNEAARLKPRLSQLVILVPEAHRAPGLEIARNQTPVGQGQWGLELPVDPGKYEISARAPGKEPWSATVEVLGEGARQTVTVPRLAAAQQAPAPVQPDVPAAPELDAGPAPTGGGWTTLHYTGLGLAAAGVIGLGIGGFFALDAASKDEDSGCDDGACPDRASLDRQDDARAAGNIATVATISGLVLAGAGAALFLIAPERPAERAGVRLVPALSERFAGAVVGGRF